MAKCGACGKHIQASSPSSCSCSSCPLIFHKFCLSLAETVSINKDWSCPECKKKIRRGDNSNTPVRGLTASLTSCESASDGHSGKSTTAGPGLVELAIQELRRELAESMTEIRQDMAEFRSVLSEFKVRMDTFDNRLVALEQKRQSEDDQTSKAELERTVSELKKELNERDQDSLLSDIEIGHLPEEKGENITHTVIVLAARLGVVLEERDVVFAERIGASAGEAQLGDKGEQRARRVVVRLARRSQRDQLLQAARVRRTLTAAAAGGAATDTRRIFINERLTRANRQLFYQVRAECRNKHWRYSWTKRGRVYVRQGEGKPVHLIRSSDDVLRVFGTDVVS